jgi:hypothetical protein
VPPDLADLLSPDVAMTAVTPIAITTTIANATEMLRRLAFVARIDISAPA